MPASGSLADLAVPPKTDGERNGEGAALILQQHVVALMRAGADLALMREQMRARFPHVTQVQVDNTYAEILRGWRALAHQTSADSRTLVVARLKQDLAKMRAGDPEQFVEYVPDEKTKRLTRRVRTVNRVNWSAVRGHERLLAQIEGTLAPIKLQLQSTEQLREGFIERISEMSPEEQERRIKEVLQRKRDAAAIVVPGVASG